MYQNKFIEYYIKAYFMYLVTLPSRSINQFWKLSLFSDSLMLMET